MRALVLGALLAGGAISMTAAAMQQAPQPRVVEADKIRDNLYVMKGGGGNSAVFITANGVVVVDTKNPGWGQPLLDKIKLVTNKPVTTIINTHTHGDHVSGNVEFPATVDIVTHENTRTGMTSMKPASFVAQPAGGPPPNIFTANQGKGMPKRTFKDRLTIGSGADQIDLYYLGRAHTDGDAIVVFPSLRVMHMADVFPTKGLPGMDANNGGSGIEYADALTKAADLADKSNIEVVINGHNAATTTRADLREYSQYVRDFVKHVQDGKRAGQSVDQVSSSWKTPATYAGYEATPPAVRVKAVTELIFSETK